MQNNRQRILLDHDGELESNLDSVVLTTMPRRLLKKIIELSNQKQFPPPLDGELLYSKNTVSIHPPGVLSGSLLHHSGFLALTAKVVNSDVSLILNWSPKTNVECERKEHGKDACEITESCVSKNISNTADELMVVELHQPDDVLNEASLSQRNNGLFVSGCQRQLVSVNNDVDPSVSVNTKESTDRGRNPTHQAFASFAIDLGLMRSIRIYFRNEHLTNGEIIIASSDCQYKILHFHCGGLDSIASILKQWKVSPGTKKLYESGINGFSITFPSLCGDQLHPEEGLYRKLMCDSWDLYADEFGRIQSEINVRKAVFFGGIESSLRPVVWPYFLNLYEFASTKIERDHRVEKKLCKYQVINNEREEIFDQDGGGEFWKNVACSIEKDVLRTDRANPFFKGKDNPNLEVLHRILLNYAVYTKTSYTQGMSDLLSPLLMQIQAESDVFWCFVGLMQHTIFISSPTDVEMEKQLFFLRELLRILLPSFYSHIMECDPGAQELLFAHRWILLCFKREFSEYDALIIWEACWAKYQMNYFHLFVCVAIISLYGQDVVERKLASDEILLHFSHLALQMNGELVLRKARGLQHQILALPALPCSLHDLLCVESSQQHMPPIVCTNSQQCIEGCPHRRPASDTNRFLRFDIKKLIS